MLSIRYGTPGNRRCAAVLCNLHRDVDFHDKTREPGGWLESKSDPLRATRHELHRGSVSVVGFNINTLDMLYLQASNLQNSTFLNAMQRHKRVRQNGDDMGIECESFQGNIGRAQGLLRLEEQPVYGQRACL